MKTIKGPAIFIAQFAADEPPFNTLPNIAHWASSLGYNGIQLPTWDSRFFDLEKAAASTDYCDEIKGVLADNNLELTDLTSHLQGQLVAVHPAYDDAFDGFAPSGVHRNPKARQEWAVQQLMFAAQASANLGLNRHSTFSGSLAWPFLYPWPPRPAGLIEAAFAELARLWKPILDKFDEFGIDVCYEIHPGEDLFDGASFERFLDLLDGHPRCNILYDTSHLILQQLDYLHFIDLYHERIKVFVAKDGEFVPDGRQGVYSGYSRWEDRAGRFRSLGDGQVDFKSVFSRLAKYNFDGWAICEWECVFKHANDGAAEGAKFIADHIIRVADRAFDDFANSEPDTEVNSRLLGLE